MPSDKPWNHNPYYSSLDKHYALEEGIEFTVTIETNKASEEIDPCCCAIQIKSGESGVTVGRIPRENFQHCCFFSKEQGGRVNGDVFSTTYQPSHIP